MESGAGYRKNGGITGSSECSQEKISESGGSQSTAAAGPGVVSTAAGSIEYAGDSTCFADDSIYRRGGIAIYRD